MSPTSDNNLLWQPFQPLSFWSGQLISPNMQFVALKNHNFVKAILNSHFWANFSHLDIIFFCCYLHQGKKPVCTWFTHSVGMRFVYETQWPMLSLQTSQGQRHEVTYADVTWKLLTQRMPLQNINNPVFMDQK